MKNQAKPSSGSTVRAARIHAISCIAAVLFALGKSAAADPAHGIAMYGNPALPQDFVSLPYANPQAPKGGRIVLGESGGFTAFIPSSCGARRRAS